MMIEFPILNDYDNLWSLDIMLITQLKYATAASKGSTMKKTVNTVHSILGVPLGAVTIHKTIHNRVAE
jgi:hypothetical protein